MATGRWSFSGEVCEVFEDHIRRSVPGYDALHELVVSYGLRKVNKENALICELGSSTGTLTRRLASALPWAQVLGVELEARMVAAAERFSPPSSEISYLCADARVFEPPRTDLFVACYTLQFLPVQERLPLLQRLYEALKPGGSLFLAEKVTRENAKDERRARRELSDFKRGQGFTDAEIRAKSKSLEGVLVSLPETTYPRWLISVGFTKVERVFDTATFVAWTAVKREQ